MAKPILDTELWPVIEQLMPPPKLRRERYPGHAAGRPQSAHRNSLRAAVGHPLGNALQGDGLPLEHELLATAAGVAGHQHLLGFGEWDGDPNERFTLADSQRWLARFDDDGDWPAPEARGRAPDAPRASPPAMHAIGGEPCPRSGWWVSAARHDARRRFEEGETLPSFQAEETRGHTLWQWDTDQGEPVAVPLSRPHTAASGEPAPRAGLWLQANHPQVRCRVMEGEPLPLVDGLPVQWQWTEQPPPGMRAITGQPCPYPGIWHCEDIPVGPRAFLHRDPLLQVQGRDVIWFLVQAQ